MKSAIEIIKEEFMSRYNLREDQVAIEIKLRDIEKDLAEQIVHENGEDLALVGEYCGVAHNKNFNMYVHYPEKEYEDVAID